MKKILFINQDIAPYVEETPMSIMCKENSCGMQDAGFETRTFMPRWGIINERRGQLHEVIRLSGINISIGNLDLPLLIKVASIVGSKAQVYFIDNEELYGKKNIKKSRSKSGIYAEFFARGVIETVKKLRWSPDIIHCQGTITHQVPYLLKKLYADEPVVNHAKVITSLFEKDSIKTAQSAIDNSNGIILASDTYNKNLLQYISESKVKTLKKVDCDDIIKKYIEFYNKV